MNSKDIQILNFCKEIQETIDWEYEEYSYYQDMMSDIYELTEKIIDVIASKENN